MSFAELDEITRARLDRAVLRLAARCKVLALTVLIERDLKPEERAELERIQRLTRAFPDVTPENAAALVAAMEQEIAR